MRIIALSGIALLASMAHAAPAQRWYRLVLVNINGTWKVLGNDSYSFSCGC
ncbi:hypothetical protein [Massilia rubra]|uniref:hypothetical protein n=1 Tax=Massilia rubra TaxID=2607910 RepID=UPI0014245B9D|nr:hypothetical protein [Massilia rubra]